MADRIMGREPKDKKTRVLILVLTVVMLGNVCLLYFYPPFPEKIVQKAYHQAYDELRDDWNAGDSSYFSLTEEKYYKRTKHCRYRCEEEIEVLISYLKAQNAAHDWGPEGAYKYQAEYLKKVPENYDGYLAEEILALKQEATAKKAAMEAVTKNLPECALSGCSRKVMVDHPDENLHVEVYDYCREHNCTEDGCRKCRVTKFYCREHSSESDFCSEPGCNEPVDPDKQWARYCKKHICSEPDCKLSRDPGSMYCLKHRREKEAEQQQEAAWRASQKAQKQKSGSSGKADPYDVDSFDDPDDFADEWAEEFGDGDFDEGWEDAWDYWWDEQ